MSSEHYTLKQWRDAHGVVVQQLEEANAVIERLKRSDVKNDVATQITHEALNALTFPPPSGNDEGGFSIIQRIQRIRQ